ncbi:glycosyltransferase family 4 protein [Haloarcula sp. Atlit-120R]|nr:glycosyltransferase family 4 protein [Haloarcula sp. Atlit-120R]
MAARLAEQYDKRGHIISVLTTSSETERPTAFTAMSPNIDSHNDITVYCFPRPPYRQFRSYHALYNPWTSPSIQQWFAHHAVDAVHAHNVHEFLSYDALRAASTHTDSVVLTYHDGMSFAYGKVNHFVDGDPNNDGRPPSYAYCPSELHQIRRAKFQYNPVRNRVNKWYLSTYINHGIAVSHELGRALRANGRPVDYIIHNGIDPQRYLEADGNQFRDKYGLNEQPFILFGGRASDLKGGTQLARAIACSETQPLLVLTGENKKYAEKLRSMHPQISIRETGWVDEDLMPSAMSAAATVATPSVYLEPFNLQNLEAMAAGTPPITTCYGGPPEVVEDDRTGFVVNPFSTREFADRIDALIQHADKCQELGHNAQQNVTKSFTIEDTASKYLSHLMA